MLLEPLRHTIKKAAPGAEEVISYGIPAFKSYGVPVWFAAHKNYIGFNPFFVSGNCLGNTAISNICARNGGLI